MKQTTTVSTLLFLLLSIFLSGCFERITEKEKAWIIQKTKKSLVFVEGGTFMMGDVGGFTFDRDTVPVHQVTLDSYSIQKFEVTFQEFDLYSKAMGEEIVVKEKRHRKHLGPEHPALYLNWYQAQEYCQWLGELLKVPMNLPTEAQWEYAARSRGKAVAHATDNGDIEYERNYRSPAKHGIKTMPPGSWPPNPLGLYDMSGNVSEWTLDWYGRYSSEPQVNPTGPKKGLEKVRRGSGMIGGKGQIQLYRRGTRKPTNTGGGQGIRCVVNQQTPVR